MSERPKLNKELDGKTFRSYYYLKKDLIEFCRENNLPVLGGKIGLTERIAFFLDTGKVTETNVVLNIFEENRKRGIGIR